VSKYKVWGRDAMARVEYETYVEPERVAVVDGFRQAVLTQREWLDTTPRTYVVTIEKVES
jgi:hypothetical protein